MENHYKGTLNFATYLVSLAEAKRALLFRKYQLRLLVKIELMKWEPYTEEYFFLINDMYDIIDGVNASDGPSRWKFTTEALNKHDMALS